MILHALASLTETRDFETGAHLVRTSRYARALGEALASQPKFRDLPRKCWLFRDPCVVAEARSEL